MVSLRAGLFQRRRSAKQAAKRLREKLRKDQMIWKKQAFGWGTKGTRLVLKYNSGEYIRTISYHWIKEQKNLLITGIR